MSAIVVRACTAEDKAEIVALWRRCFGHHDDDPGRQLEQALAAPISAVFVAREGDSFAGAAIAGSDGLRGRLRHLAVVPARRNRGVARAIVRHCEAWLAETGVSKIKLEVRADAPDAMLVWRHLGYGEETHAAFGKRLSPPRDAPLPPTRSGEPGCIDVVVTHLEMTAPPPGPPPKPPALKLAVLKVEDISLAYYRFLYAETGRDWIWHERRRLDDAALAALVQHPQVDIFVPYVGGMPSGYAEIDRRELPEDVELRFFGLMPPLIGRGLGAWLLDWTVREAWRHGPRRLRVNTCSLDHPRALALYQRAGFIAVRQETKTIRDPRPLK